MKKHLVFVIVFLLAAVTAQAQETTFWEKVNDKLTKYTDLDTTRIYQPKGGFSLGLFTTGQKAGFDVNIGFDIVDIIDEEGTSLPGTTAYNISESLCKKIGLEAGYGKVVLGYGLEVGQRSASKKRSLALNLLGPSWGVHFNYFSISNPFNTSIELGEQGSESYWQYKIVADDLATLRSLSIDGYYVFNSKRFAYPATYKVGLVQRRTAGSWMLTARYMQGSLVNTPEGALSSLSLLDCFSTMQISLGGGYSVNFVLWHKDPTEQRDQGLRNLTLNVTAMPVITLFNYLKTMAYEYDEELHYTGESVTKVVCWPMPNYVGSAALGFSWNRFFFSTQFTYNWFYFRNRNAFNDSQFDLPNYDLSNVRVQGAFHNWTLKGTLTYRY